MTLKISGARGELCYGGRSERKAIEASDEWIERAQLRMPEYVRVVAGSAGISGIEKKCLEFLKTSGTPVMLILEHCDADVAEKIESTGVSIETIRWRSVDAGAMPPNCVKWNHEIEVLVSDANIPGIGEFIANADCRKAILRAREGLGAASIIYIREHVRSWSDAAAAKRMTLAFLGMPLCCVPPELFEAAEHERDAARVLDVAKCPAPCRECIALAICDFPVLATDANAISMLLPHKDLDSFPTPDRRTFSRLSRELASDNIFRLSIFGPCNNRCEDCPEKAYTKPALPTRGALKLITKAWSDGADIIYITDGEPSMRKDLPDLLKVVSWYGMKAKIFTNGRALAVDRFLDALTGRDVSLAVRIAGPDAASHNEATKTESFEQTINGIKKAIEKGLHVELHVRLRPDILSRAGELLELAQGLGAPMVIGVPAHWIYFPDAPVYSETMSRLGDALNSHFEKYGAEAAVYIEGVPICMLGKHQNRFTPGRGPEHAGPLPCADCSFSGWCCGLPESYSLTYGATELRPDFNNNESQLVFGERSEMADFDIESCAIKGGAIASPEPGNSAIVREGEKYPVWRFEGGATFALAAKNAKENVAGAGGERLRLRAECRECPKLHECAACFEAGAQATQAEPAAFEGRTLLVGREADSEPPRRVKADDSIAFRDFWRRMSRGVSGMPVYKTIVIHDVVDYFPSAQRALGGFAALVSSGSRIIITGRNRQIVAGGKRGKDSVAVVSPWSLTVEGVPLKLVDYTLDDGGSPSYWSLVFEKIKTPAPKPSREKLASFFIIKTCVARCLMCNVQNYFKNTRMPLGRIISGMDELRLNGFEYVDLFGGEVTLRDDLEFIVRYAAAIGLKPMIITTGHSLDRARAGRLRDAGVRKITVSLDGDDSFTHEMVKGVKGLFPKALEAVGSAVSAPGIEVNVNTVLLPENFEKMPEIAKLAAGRGADSARFFLCVSSPATSLARRVLSESQLEKLIHELLPAAKDAAAERGMEIDFRPEPPARGEEPAWIKRVASGKYNPVFASRRGVCAAPNVRTLVDLDGRVYPCEVPLLFASDRDIGSLDDGSLAGILNSDKMRKFKGEAGLIDECEMCFGAMPAERREV